MNSAPAQSAATPRRVGAVPFCSDAVTLQLRPGVSELPESIRRWMETRDDIATEAGADVESALRQLADLLGSALREWVDEGGDDVRGRVLAMSLDDALGIIDGVTADDLPILQTARDAWAGKLHELAQLALEQASQLAGAHIGGLDVNGWAAAQQGALENAASTWDTQIRRVLGDGLLRASSQALYVEPDVTRQVIRDMVTDMTPAMVTEARTATAAYDRIISAAIADDLDPDGDVLRWVYSGPVDGLQRPFCVAATGLYFTRSQVARLRNRTPGMPVSDFGGGYNCRHQWLHMTARQADRAGFREATEIDVTAINLGAMR